MAKELRITFKDSEIELYNFIKSRSSYSGFLKDLAMIEQQRLNNYINGFSNNIVYLPNTDDRGQIEDNKHIKYIEDKEPTEDRFDEADEFDIDLDDII